MERGGNGRGILQIRKDAYGEILLHHGALGVLRIHTNDVISRISRLDTDCPIRAVFLCQVPFGGTGLFVINSIGIGFCAAGCLTVDSHTAALFDIRSRQS